MKVRRWLNHWRSFHGPIDDLTHMFLVTTIHNSFPNIYYHENRCFSFLKYQSKMSWNGCKNVGKSCNITVSNDQLCERVDVWMRQNSFMIPSAKWLALHAFLMSCAYNSRGSTTTTTTTTTMTTAMATIRNGSAPWMRVRTHDNYFLSLNFINNSKAINEPTEPQNHEQEAIRILMHQSIDFIFS